MGNIKPLSDPIVFNRLRKKHKFSDYLVAQKVERFWESKWPVLYLERGLTTREIIRQKILPIVNLWLKNSVPKRARIIEKKNQVILRNLRKDSAKRLKELINRKAAKQESDRQNAAKLVHLFINEFNSKSDRVGTTARNTYVKYDYQIEKIPKWIKWSDKKILKYAFEILEEIRSILIRRDKIRKYYRHNGKILSLGGNPLGLRVPGCINRQCRVHYPVVKKPFPEVLKIGTNKWLDEEAFKKYKKAALRRKSNELVTKQAIEKAWNSLTNPEGSDGE